MFGTLHWNSHTKEAEFVERPHGSSNPEMNSACDRCRAKKVKCSANGKSCSRCNRLRKMCTFTSIRHRGNQRTQKANINITQQECSLDLLIQSPASPGSKDTGHEEEVSSDKQSLTTTLPPDGDIDDGERRQQLLAEPPTDRLADIPSNFDLSFLTEYGQRTSDQDGDDIFNLTLLPFPFCSTILPSTQPGPIPPAAARPSEHLPSPALSSGDESSSYFPPTRPSQASSLFEIGANDTPASLDASTLVSTAFSSQDPSGQSCQCLAAVVFAVEEFEASCNSGNRAELDSIVAHQKEAIKCCRSMLKCGSCMVKRENLVLLVFMTEKIVAACGQIVVLYRTKDGDAWAGSVPSLLLGCLPSDRLSHRVDAEDRDLATSASSSPSRTDRTRSGSIVSTRTGTSSDWQELLLGDYEISSPLEWGYVVRVLIFLQLRAVMELLADMKNMGSKVLGETQTASLAQAAMRVGELQKDIHII